MEGELPGATVADVGAAGAGHVRRFTGAPRRRLVGHDRRARVELDQAVLLELRLQGVAGTTIAGVLTEVESHVVDSGEDARSAFGDPVEYARSLELPPDPRQEPDAGAASVAQSAAQVLGVTEADVMAVLESGELKGRKIGSTWRIPRAAITSYMS